MQYAQPESEIKYTQPASEIEYAQAASGMQYTQSAPEIANAQAASYIQYAQPDTSKIEKEVGDDGAEDGTIDLCTIKCPGDQGSICGGDQVNSVNQITCKS